jgi:RNA polymerase sigma-70 factor (ECF subfamily)
LSCRGVEKNPAFSCNTNRHFAFILLDMTASTTEPSDEHRFAEWLRVHGKAVEGFLLAMVGRPDVADDLTQEVFCRAWQARGSYKEQGSSRAYLLRIADRLACDRYRRKGPERTLNEEGWKQHEPLSRWLGPAEAAATAEMTGRLAVAMEHLSPIQRRVLLLRYYGQLSFQEIAEVIPCPLNTAASHCHRGLESLRKLLVE